MKRKYLIIISSIIFLITISFIGIFTYQKYEQNKKEKEQAKLVILKVNMNFI